MALVYSLLLVAWLVGLVLLTIGVVKYAYILLLNHRSHITERIRFTPGVSFWAGAAIMAVMDYGFLIKYFIGG